MRLSLRSVYKASGAPEFLYALLEARVQNLEMNISHQGMPTFREHMTFIRSRPYRAWYLIKRGGRPVGTIYATRLNEIGIHLMPGSQGKGIARWALQQFMNRHRPLAAIPAHRAGHWLANIHPKNERSTRLFEDSGFKHIQNTYQL